jgi:hypothetical protein
VLPAREPFADALAGDGNGSILFFLPDYPLRSQYIEEIYDRQGARVARVQGQYAEADSILRPTPLVQKDGFQLLEGDGINIAKLNTYSSSGELMKSTPVPPAHGLVSSVDVRGGSLVVSHVFPPGGTPPGPHYPWILTAQMFDEHGAQRGPARAVAGDPAGQSMVTRFGGAVTTNGWTFVAWTAKTDDTPPVYNDLQGAWVNPSGRASPAFSLGSVLESGRLDVAALASGGVAVAAFSQASQRYDWLAQIHEGAGPSPAGWLDAFSYTRVAIVRGGRAHAVLVGAPSWPGASTATECQTAVTVTLTSMGGTTCGAFSLPVPKDPALTCMRTSSSAAVALDGSIVVRTLESGTDSDGATRASSVAAVWPGVLK